MAKTSLSQIAPVTHYWRWVGIEGTFIPGLPSRDLTIEEHARLEQRLARIVQESALWVLTEVKTERTEGDGYASN